MENPLVTFMGSTNTENESNTLSGSVISVVLLFYLFIFLLNSAQSSGKKVIGNVTAKNYLKESLSPILCFIVQ